jgi:hypothetical protein
MQQTPKRTLSPLRIQTSASATARDRSELLNAVLESVRTAPTQWHAVQTRNGSCHEPHGTPSTRNTQMVITCL